MFNKI